MHACQTKNWSSSFKLKLHQNHLESCLKLTRLGPTFRVFELITLGWGPGIVFSNEFPGDADTAGSETPIRAAQN